MLTNTERQQIVEEVNAGTYGIDEALDDIAAAQKGEEVRKALYAEALVLNREGHAGSTDMIARQQIANLQTSVNGQIGTLRTEVGDDIDDLETALNSGLATQNGKIAAQDASIANVVANYNVEYGSTELWASTGETGALAAGTTVTLSEDISHFDYVDIYSFCGNSNVLDTVPVDAKLQSSQGYALRWVNLSDPDSGSYKAYVRIIETRLHIIGTTLTIDHQVTYRNGEEVNISGAEITQSNRSTYMGELGIMKIVGRKITANTEIEDVRIGADGTEYASAGQAVRAQVTALESAIPAVDSTLSTQGAAADAKVAGDKVTELKSALNSHLETIDIETIQIGTSLNINAIGQIVAGRSDCGIYAFEVKKNFEYTVNTTESNLVCAFFEGHRMPRSGDTAYDGVRIIQDNKNIVASIDGWIAFRSSATQTTESATAVVMVDNIARDELNGIGNVIKPIGKKTTIAAKILGNGAICTITATGVIGEETGQNHAIYYARVNKGITYTVLEDDVADGDLICAFYISEPAINSVSYNGTRIVQSSNVITSPIDGWIAFRSRNTQTDEAIVFTDYAFVTPEMYGAKGDGLTDDTVAITTALNSGFAVSFSKKTYLCADVLIEGTDGLYIHGNGAELYLPDGTDNKKWWAFVNCSNININGIKFNGNRSNQTIKTTSDGVAGKDTTENSPAILFDNSHDCMVCECRFVDCQGDGIQIDRLYYDQTATNGNVSYSIRIENCDFDATGRNGVAVVHAHDVIISKCNFKNIQIYSSTVAIGVDLEPNQIAGFVCRDVKVLGCTFSNCVWGVNLAVAGTLAGIIRTIVANNIIDSCTYGIDLYVRTGEAVRLVNNSITNCSRAINGVGLNAGLLVANNSISKISGIGVNFNVVEDSTIISNTINAAGVYGISMAKGTNISIEHNIISGTNESGAHVYCAEPTRVRVVRNDIRGNKATVVMGNGSNNIVIHNNVDDSYAVNVPSGLIADNKTIIINQQAAFTATAANTLEYSGLSATIPPNADFNVMARLGHNNSVPVRVVLSSSSSAVIPTNTYAEGVFLASMSGYSTSAITVYVWVESDAAGSNYVNLSGTVKY